MLGYLCFFLFELILSLFLGIFEILVILQRFYASVLLANILSMLLILEFALFILLNLFNHGFSG